MTLGRNLRRRYQQLTRAAMHPSIYLQRKLADDARRRDADQQKMMEALAEVKARTVG